MFKPASVTPLPDYRLKLVFPDGVEGEVDLSHLVGRGVFAAWQDPHAFNEVSIGDAGQLHWTDEIELCSDSLYLQITGKTAAQAFAEGDASSCLK
jgi:hypothetical protein